MEARDVRKTAADCGEDETVRRAREGDAEAFSELVRRYRARAYGLARKLTNDDRDQIQGKSEQLLGKIQERYGLARDEAQRQFDAWSPTRAEQRP